MVNDLYRRYHLEGPNEGTTTSFAMNLPGFPDNIRLSSRGGFWVACTLVRDRHIIDVTRDKPDFRTVMSLVSIRVNYKQTRQNGLS